MKRFFLIGILLLLVATVPQTSAQTVVYDAQVMREVVEHYCRDTRPVASCGVYQEDIEFAQQKAAQMIAVIGAQPTGQKATLVEGMLERIARSFYTAQDPRQKLVSARYYLYFNQVYSWLNSEKIAQLTDILYDYREDRPLFTVTNPVDYSTRPYVVPQPQPTYQYQYPYQYTTSPIVSTVTVPTYSTTARGAIQSISPLKSDTTIRNWVIASESRTGEINLRIHTGAGSTAASRNNGYRVVATTRSTGSQIFAANYTSNGNWELRMRPNAAIGDLTIYLLCQKCGAGSTFTQGNTYYGWTAVDSSTYSVGYHRNSKYTDEYDRYDRYDYNRYYDQHYDDYEYTRRSNNRTSYDRWRYEDGYFHQHR